jgi:hypothetical protein
VTIRNISSLEKFRVPVGCMEDVLRQKGMTATFDTVAEKPVGVW